MGEFPGNRDYDAIRSRQRRFTSIGLPKRSFEFFRDVRNKQEFCDIAFRVGSESIFAHRVIISAVIPYFRNILSATSEETEEGIILPEIDSDAFKSLIDFAYGCELIINVYNVKDLLTTACYLGLDEIREECCDFMSSMMEIENVMNILDFARNLNCSDLIEIADRYIRENFVEMSETEDFLKWPFTYVEQVVSQDGLNVDDESQVLEAVLRWTKYCKSERNSKLPHLLRLVRMTQLEPLYLTQIVEQEDLLRTSLACRDLFDEAKTYRLFPEMRKNVCSFTIRPRLSMLTFFSLDFGKEHIYKFHYQIKSTVQHFDIVQEEWFTDDEKVFYENLGSATVWRNNMYYFVWGYTIFYDPKNNFYIFLNGMPTPRSFVAAACLKNKIYVCGGGVGTKATNVVECFDPFNNEWTNVTSMRTARMGHSAVAIQGHVYVLGGRDESLVHDSVERYNPATDKWRTMPPMSIERCHAGAAVLNGKIYVCGGKTRQSGARGIVDAEVYDPVKNEWKTISPMSMHRHTFTLLSCGGKLHAIGGDYDAKLHLHKFEIYDPESDEWTCGPSTDVLHTTSAAVVMSAV